MNSCSRIAKPLPRSLLGPRADVAVTSEHGADPDVPRPRLQGGTTRLPIRFVPSQQPEEKKILNHYQLFTCHF